MATLEFTKPETDFIMHRLESYDTIADSFASDGREHSDDDVQVAALALIHDIKTDALNVADLTDCERDVLRDAIEGNTYCAEHPNNLPDPERARWYRCRRAARSAIEKLRGAGLECDDPIGLD